MKIDKFWLLKFVQKRQKLAKINQHLTELTKLRKIDHNKRKSTNFEFWKLSKKKTKTWPKFDRVDQIEQNWAKLIKIDENRQFLTFVNCPQKAETCQNWPKFDQNWRKFTKIDQIAFKVLWNELIYMGQIYVRQLSRSHRLLL